MSFHVYILLSRKDGHLYVGQTSDLEKRIKAHNDGRVKSTKHRRPLDLVYCEEFGSRGEAIKRERWLKQPESSEFKRQIKENLLSW